MIQLPNKSHYSPLGIIAIFVVFCEGFVIYAFGKSEDVLLYPWLQILIVFFMILFPVAVFCVFKCLVIKYSHLLYSPADFKDDKLWYAAVIGNSKIEMDKKQNCKSKIVVNATLPSSHESGCYGESKENVASRAIENEALAKAVLQELSQRYDLSFIDGICFASKDGRSIQIDGYAQDENCSYFVETKVVGKGRELNSVVKQLRYFLSVTKEIGRQSLKSYRIVALVGDANIMDDCNKIMMKLKQMDSDTIVLFFDETVLREKVSKALIANANEIEVGC